MRMQQQPGEHSSFHGLLGKAVLAVWCDIDPERDAEFNDWCTHQHLPERVGIPGFIRGRRWAIPKGTKHEKGGQYFTLYEIESLETLVSAPYLERLNSPTDWTKRTVPWFKNGNRTACKIIASQGQGIGGHAATIEFGPSGNTAEALRTWITLSAMPQRSSGPGSRHRQSRRFSSITKWWGFTFVRLTSLSLGRRTRLQRARLQSHAVCAAHWQGGSCSSSRSMPKVWKPGAKSSVAVRAWLHMELRKTSASIGTNCW